LYLTNKYQQEFSAHGNKALQRVITKVGTATLMTNFDHCSRICNLIITNNSELLKEFGIISSLSIVALFFYA
jgi:hypothetical protein